MYVLIVAAGRAGVKWLAKQDFCRVLLTPRPLPMQATAVHPGMNDRGFPARLSVSVAPGRGFAACAPFLVSRRDSELLHFYTYEARDQGYDC